MIWVKYVIFIVYTIDLAKCFASVNPNSVGSHLLSSVYDAIKYNDKVELTDEVSDNNLRRIGPPILLAMDSRNKRNTNNIERSDYYYTIPQENENFISKSDTLCPTRPLSKENEYSISITQGISSVAGTVGKIIFGLIAILVLPLFILKALLIPIKILLGIKTFTFVNSIFFGAMIWRFLSSLVRQNTDQTQYDEGINDSNTYPSLSNVNQINSDFGEIDVKRLLKYVKEKDKDW